MENNLIILMVLAVIIFLMAIILILFMSGKNKIHSLLIKTKISEQTINENLKSKLDLMVRIINIIERELKIESKVFEEIKRIKSDKFNNVALDSLLMNASKEVNEIKSDYKELSKTKSFDGLVADIKDLDIYLTGGRRFYNKYAAMYNNLIKTFPSSMVAKHKKLTYKNLYAESIMIEDLKIDFRD